MWNLMPRPEFGGRSPKENYLLGKKFGVEVRNFDLDDDEVANIKLIHDFMTFINYVENNKVKLTATGNICLKDLKAINSMLSIKEKWEQNIGNHIWRIRSENELPYIRLIDTLARILRLVRKFKRKLVPTLVMKDFKKLRLTEMYSILLEAYIFHINWEFLYPWSSAAKAVQDNIEAVGAVILEMQRQTKWIKLKELAGQILESLELKVIEVSVNMAKMSIDYPILRLVELF
jgi:hypothetical protein